MIDDGELTPVRDLGWVEIRQAAMRLSDRLEKMARALNRLPGRYDPERADQAMMVVSQLSELRARVRIWPSISTDELARERLLVCGQFMNLKRAAEDLLRDWEFTSR